MARRKQDHYGERAKKAGYPARSVYKLEEIQKKHRLIHRGAKVLDIGAAPGSWSMFAADTARGGSVTAVDLKEFSLPESYRNVTIFTGDAFSDEIRSQLTPRAPFDVLLSDAAPSTSGNKTVDTARSHAIAEGCIELATELLKPGGNLVVKIFQGGDEKELIDTLRSSWKTVKPFKPAASRKESFEIFLLALGFNPDAPFPPPARGVRPRP
ncbi:MAG: RlmE family RNA methyltransferase [Spirochaetaceae bacterium]